MTGGWFLFISAAGGLSGLAALIVAVWQIRKLSKETSKVEIEAAIAVDEGDDRHLLTIIEQQAQHLITPLREEVVRLRSEVEAQRQRLAESTERYWRLVSWSRDMIVWARTWHADEEGKPNHPALPPDLDHGL